MCAGSGPVETSTVVHSAEGLAVACTLGYLFTLSFTPYSLFSISPVEGAALTVSPVVPGGYWGGLVTVPYRIR